MSHPAPEGPAPATQRALALAEVLLCSGLPTQMALSVLLVAVGMAPETASGGLSGPFVVALSLTDTVVLVMLMVIFSRLHGESAWALWRGRRRVGFEVALGLLLAPVVLLTVGLLLTGMQQWAPWLHNVPANPLEQLATGGPTDAAALGLVAIVAGGLREELQRAFLLRRFETHLGGLGIGVLVLSVAFGLGHLLQGWDAAIATGVLGLLWSLLYLWRRSSIAPVVSHAAFNAVEVLRAAAGPA